MVQWLRLHASTTVGLGSIPREVLHATLCGQKEKKKDDQDYDKGKV